jgi:lysophospholipase L1-like esterase
MASRRRFAAARWWLSLSCVLVIAGCSDSSDDDPSPGQDNSGVGTMQPMAGSASGTAGSTEPGGEVDAGTSVADAGMTDAAPAREDLGAGDGSDVITIGDSWMSLGVRGIQQSLVAISGQPYRTYGRGGTRLLNEAIPGQYVTAKTADPDIQTVVMTGGGNDIIQVPGLREDCAAQGEQCSQVVGQILDRLSALWAEMAADGVQDVIYVQYSNPEGNNVDFALPSGDGVAPRCEDVPEPLRCHRLETLDIVMGDIPDGIHPSAAGYDRIGQAVYDLMIEQGMRR